MKQFGNHVARIAAVFMIFSTGMFISAAGKQEFELKLLCRVFKTCNAWF